MRKLLYMCLKVDFIAFIHKSFNTLHPTQKYRHNWHIDVIVHELKMLMTLNSQNRLLINLPPRNFKSLLISVIWVAWLLGNNPMLKIIVVSYSQRLSDKHHYDTSIIMSSDWYRAVFNIDIIKNNRFKIVTDQLGFRFATSIGASLTGEGGDLIIIDDPHNPSNIYSKIHRDSVVNWYKNTLLSRFNNHKEGRLIVVMQRLHVEDLSGYILDNENYKYLSIPLVSNSNTTYMLNECQNFIYKKNMIIDKYRYSEVIVKQLQKTLGIYCFLAQYMQQPYRLQGVIQIDTLNYYDKQKISVEEGDIVHSWDTAAVVNDHSDYSVCTIWLCKDGKYFLIDCIRDRMNYSNLMRLSCEVIKLYPPILVLVENKSSGISLIQYLMDKCNVVPINSKFSKLGRVESCLNEFLNIYLPKQHIILDVILKELSMFPNYKYDDIVDSISQFLIYMRSRNDISNISLL